MKFFYTIITVIIFVNISFGIQQRFDFFTRQSYTHEESEFRKIKNRAIKNRKLYSAYYGKNEKLPASKTLVEEVIFNKNGLPKEKIYYDSYNAVKLKYIYKYNNKLDLVQEEIYNQYNDIVFRRDISYTSKGDTSVVLISNIKKNGKERNTFSYDKNGKLEKTTRYDKNDKIILLQNFIYEDNKLKYIRFVDGDGNKFDEIEFTYNKSGNLSSELHNKIVTNYSYDEKDRLVKIESSSGDIRTYNYNAGNDIVEDQFYIEFNKRQFKLVFSYLKNGLSDEVIRYDPKDKKVFYSKYIYE